MVQEQHKHLLELIVNSSAKQQGNFTKTSELVCQLLQEHLDVCYSSVWLFDQHQTKSALNPHTPPLTMQYTKRLIAYEGFPGKYSVTKTLHLNLAGIGKRTGIQDLAYIRQCLFFASASNLMFQFVIDIEMIF